MAIYVTSKCPKCKYSFETFNPSWIAFGDPRIACPKCGQIVLFKNIKEWKLRSPLERIWIIFKHYTFHNLAYTLPVLFGIFIILVLILRILGKSYNDIINKDSEALWWTVIGAIIFIIIGIFRHKSFYKEIKESNQRMNNKEYVNQIINLY